MATSFNDTCVVVSYPCQLNSKFYVDPCNCTQYYECVFQNSIISRPCGPGTLFNHKTKLCDLPQADGSCNTNAPWQSCQEDIDDSGSSVTIQELQQRCTGSTPHTESPVVIKSPQERGVDGGAIAGIVIAILVVAVVVIALIIYTKRRGNPFRKIQQSKFWQEWVRRENSGSATRNSDPGRPPSQPPDEEVYAEIDDSAMYQPYKNVIGQGDNPGFFDTIPRHHAPSPAKPIYANVENGSIVPNQQRHNYRELKVDNHSEQSGNNQNHSAVPLELRPISETSDSGYHLGLPLSPSNDPQYFEPELTKNLDPYFELEKVNASDADETVG